MSRGSRLMPGKPSYARAGVNRSLAHNLDRRTKAIANDLNTVEAAVTAATPILLSVGNKVDEAPNDGQTYSRKGLAWQKLSGAVIAGLPAS